MTKEKDWGNQKIKKIKVGIKTNAELIHESLAKKIKNREIEIFFKKYAGKAKIVDYSNP